MTEEIRPLHEKWMAFRKHRRSGGLKKHTEFLSDEEFIAYHALRGKRDLYFLGKYVLGFTWLEAPLHVDLAYAWTRPNGSKDESGRVYGRERLTLIPRGHLKTTLLTQSSIVYDLINNPEERILLYSANAALAEGIMSPIKTLLQGGGTHGQFFLQCYPYLVPNRKEKDKWTNSILIVKRKGAYTDPSIKASGVGSVLTSGHFTKFYIDDIVGEELPREQMMKTVKAYDGLSYLSASMATSEKRISGTRWAFFDVYSRIMRRNPHVCVALRGWMEKDGKLADDGDRANLIYKQRGVAREKGWSLERAQTEFMKEALQKKADNPYLFSCQFKNNPRDESRLGFNEDWWQYARREGDFIVDLDADGKPTRKIRLDACNVYILVDPNTGRLPGERTADNNIRKTTDYAGFIVLAVAPDNVWYVLRAYRKRWSPDVIVDQTFNLVDIWQPKKVIFEQRAAQYVFASNFRQEFKRGRPAFLLDDFKGGNDSKQERIKALMPKYKAGMIRHLEGSVEVNKGTAALEEELLDFPNADYDDLGDALSGAIGKVYAPGASPLAAIRRKQREEDDLEKLDPGSARAWRSVIRQRENQTSSWFSGDTIDDAPERYE